MLQISGAAGELGISLGQGFNVGLSQCLGQQTKDGWWMDCHINDCHISRLLGLWLGDLEFSAMHFPKHPRMKAHKQGNKIRECWGGKPFGECWDDQVVLVKTSKVCDRSVNLTMGDGVHGNQHARWLIPHLDSIDRNVAFCVCGFVVCGCGLSHTTSQILLLKFFWSVSSIATVNSSLKVCFVCFGCAGLEP